MECTSTSFPIQLSQEEEFLQMGDLKLTFVERFQIVCPKMFLLACVEIDAKPVDHMCLCAGSCITRCHLQDFCGFTCPGVMDPPCNRASRQLRAAVRIAAAVRPACHTRFGSSRSCKNFGDSSWKCLEGGRVSQYGNTGAEKHLFVDFNLKYLY